VRKRSLNNKQLSWCSAALLASVAASLGPARAQVPAFQTFLQNACVSGATGTLAANCQQSDPGPAGNVRNASEDSLNPTHFFTLDSNTQYRARLELEEVQRRLEERRDQQSGRPGALAYRARNNSLASADLLSQSSGTPSASPWSLFGQARWTKFDHNATAQERGFSGDTRGVRLGADYRYSDRLLLGGVFGYDRTDSDFDNTEGNTDTDSYSLSAYANVNVSDRLYLEGVLSVGHNDYSLRRNVIFTPVQTNIPFSTSGDTQGRQYSASVGGGYDVPMGAFTVTPYARLNFIHTSVDSFAETGASGFEMRVDKTGTDSLTSVIGVRGSYAISVDWGVIVPQARFEYEHEFRDNAHTMLTSFVQDSRGTRFGVTGDAPDPNYFNIGLGVAFLLPNGVFPFVDYEGLAKYKNLDRHTFVVGLRLEF
jgi:outer membrane autotransporter protein